MKIAIAQISPILGNLEKNIELHLKFIEEAKAGGAETVIFPELSLTGYSLKDINYEIALDPFKTDKLDKLKEASKEIDLICGLAELGKNFGIYNSAAYISGGEVKFTHKKIYPPTYGIFEELRYFSKGSKCTVCETKLGTTGILVCEDLWHLSLPLTQALGGAKIIIGIAASPTRVAPDTEGFRNYEVNCEHHKTYSRLLSAYTVFCNRVGYEDGVNFWGGSEVVDPFGNVIAKADILKEQLIFAVIDENEVKRARNIARHFLDEDIYLTIRNLMEIALVNKGG